MDHPFGHHKVHLKDSTDVQDVCSRPSENFTIGVEEVYPEDSSSHQDVWELPSEDFPAGD